MKSLYLISHSGLINLIMFLFSVSFLQSIATAYSVFCIRLQKIYVIKSVREALILCHILLVLAAAAQSSFYSQDGIMAVTTYVYGYFFVFASILFLSLWLFIKNRRFSELLPAIISFFIMPYVQELSGNKASYIVFGAVSVFAVRSFFCMDKCSGMLKENLSPVSIKEAVDSLNFGILFCRADRFSYGQILLANKKARELMLTMTGNVFYDGSEFYRRLSSGNILPSCKVNRLGEKPVYTLPDNSVWRFEMQVWTAEKRKYFLLMASDSTELKRISDELAIQNKALNEKNGELKVMLRNLESICRKEETFRVKNQVHDILGQRISMILRSVRENKEPDEALLSSFADGLPVDLKNAAADYNASLRRMADSFRKLGININIDGKLPPNAEMQKTFFEIMTEAMTNAVHHGYATQIDISVCLTCGEWVLFIKNNGLTADEPVMEGGGLTFIREKVSSLGGTFTYISKPQFAIIVKVPEGGSL